jgi:hypothetical protein
MNIVINQRITQGVLEDVIVTALEGGSNHWYFISDEAIRIVRKAMSDYLDLPLSVAIARAVIEKGVTVPINDFETMHEVLGELSMSTMPNRMQELANDDGYSYALRQEMAKEGDGGTSDIVFQYMCLGKVEFA